MFKDIQATIEINLQKPVEELWNNLDKDARWGVKKAKKEDLKVKISNKPESWNEFYDIYKQTIIHGGVTPKELNELKQESDKLFLCLKDNKIIAGAAIKIKQDKTVLFLNASLYDYLKLQPNNLLYWAIIIWSKKYDF